MLMITVLMESERIKGMSNKEIVDLLHRLGKDAELTYWSWEDDSIYVYKDFWEALSSTLQALGIKAECPLCKDVLTKE